jgi:hypothetical protein
MFTEGFDTPDLKEAKALLDELASSGQNVVAADLVVQSVEAITGLRLHGVPP